MMLIEFHPGRGKKVPEQLLGDWSNTLNCDGHRDDTPDTLTNGITCGKQNGINPDAYIEDVLMAVATTPSSQIASLTPWVRAEARKGAAATESATVSRSFERR